MSRRKIVTLCGSTRFYAAFQKANYRETMAGRVVLSVGVARAGARVGRLSADYEIPADPCPWEHIAPLLTAAGWEDAVSCAAGSLDYIEPHDDWCIDAKGCRELLAFRAGLGATLTRRQAFVLVTCHEYRSDGPFRHRTPLPAWAGQWSTHGGRHYFAASILGEYVGGTVRPEDTREGTSA